LVVLQKIRKGVEMLKCLTRKEWSEPVFMGLKGIKGIDEHQF
jgi:hypothetical protein